MPNELYFQRIACKSAKDIGGVGLKLSNSLSAVGIPDCVFSFSETGSAFVEFKLLKVNRDEYKRKIALTKLQRKTLKDIASAGGVAFIGVIVYLGIGKWRVCAYPPDVEHASNTDSVPYVQYDNGRIPMEELIGAYRRSLHRTEDKS